MHCVQNPIRIAPTYPKIDGSVCIISVGLMIIFKSGSAQSHYFLFPDYDVTRLKDQGESGNQAFSVLTVIVDQFRPFWNDYN